MKHVLFLDYADYGIWGMFCYTVFMEGQLSNVCENLSRERNATKKILRKRRMFLNCGIGELFLSSHKPPQKTSHRFFYLSNERLR